MRDAYIRGSNAIALVRYNSTSSDNTLNSTLIAFYLQTGNCVDDVHSNLVNSDLCCNQLAGLLSSNLTKRDCFFELGVGEASTLTDVMKTIICKDVSVSVFGFDLSWSKWSTDSSVNPHLFVGDLLHTP